MSGEQEASVSEHDFKKALAQFEKDRARYGEITFNGDQKAVEAALAALRSAAALQDAREAVERGEAVLCRIPIAVFDDGEWHAYGFSQAETDEERRFSCVETLDRTGEQCSFAEVVAFKPTAPPATVLSVSPVTEGADG